MSQEKGKRRIPLFDKNRQYHECRRKKGYSTTRDANKDIHRARVRDGIRLSYYRCSYCGKYHLTKKFVKSKF